ncbi:MAG: hypothetical protein ACRDOI_40570 [Trebonia sp.]
MAVAALLLWLCTAAVGAYLLVSSVHSGNTDHSGNTEPAAAEPVPVPGPVPRKPTRARDRFDPPSLQRAKSEPLPGLKELAEFAHPALAIIGLGFWLGYVVSRDLVFAAIGLGILLGAIGAGVSWFIVNTRAARRAAAADAESGPAAPGAAPLSPSPRVLTLHAIGAALTLLFTVLIAVRG